jgi:glycosyltransferase involved in cell wall biosynthesis
VHIALFSPAWPLLGSANGIVTYVHHMRQELLAQGHRVSIFTRELCPGIADTSIHLVAPSFRNRITRSISARLNIVSLPAFDAGEALANQISRVHLTDPLDAIEMEESFGMVGRVARMTPVPIVCKLHGPAFLTMIDGEMNTPKGREKVRDEGAALMRLQAITAPSQCTLMDTVAHYDLAPAIAQRVVNPISADRLLPAWDVSRCDRNTVLFVGRFDRIKGADLIIRAFQGALAKRPSLRLIFVGPDRGLVEEDGRTVHIKEFVSSLSDPALERAMIYRGHLTSSEVDRMRTSALVTVIASRRESQGYTALEAMNQACPVVCTGTSGLAELVEHEVTGLKARPEDADDLAEQILRIVDDPQLGRLLGLAAREYVRKVHAPGAVVEQTIDVYKRTIALYRKQGD